MKTATVKELKTELEYQSKDGLLELCMHLSKFKKENKELLTYLLFESENEARYIEGIKEEINKQFELINTSSYYYIKKSVRKILRMVKKYYSIPNVHKLPKSVHNIYIMMICDAME